MNTSGNKQSANNSKLLHLWGTIAHRTGDYKNAAKWISAAIQSNPENAVYYANLGDVLNQQGQLNQAIVCYRKALEANPEFDEIYFKLGAAHHDQNNLSAAISCYRKAVEKKPNFVEALYNLAHVYQAQNAPDEAISYYDHAIRVKPDFAEAHNNKGKAYKEKGDLKKAAACFERALQLKADFAEPYFNLADVLSTLGQMEAAIENYRLALRYRPNMIEAYNNLGNTHKSRGEFDTAIENYKQVITLSPDLAEAYYNLGSTLRLKGEFQAAISHLKHALRLKPRYVAAHNNLGLTYKNQGNLDRALECFSNALRIDPDLAEAHWNRSFVYLLKGEFEKGWQDYDWRFQQTRWQTLYPRRYGGPRWDGSTCRHKTIFIHDEQGLGDTLQFVRYIPAVKSRCWRVIFETRQSLIPLLQGFPGIDQIVARSSYPHSSENWDVYIPLLSLPKVFGTTRETIPCHVPYIFADSEKTAHWKQRLDGRGFKIGIVWAGRAQHTNDRNRSCQLKQFTPLAQIAGIQLIGLQKGEAASQTRQMPAEMALINYGEEFEDFSDTAALMENLDLVISVDTAVAHLAGAMGKTVWVLLPFVPDWRWMMEREDSPWYPTMRLFRQNTRGDWEPVFQRIERHLRRLVDSSSQKIQQK